MFKLRPHGQQHTRLSCPALSSGIWLPNYIVVHLSRCGSLFIQIFTAMCTIIQGMQGNLLGIGEVETVPNTLTD